MTTKRNIGPGTSGLLLGGVALVLLVLSGCGRHEDPWDEATGEGPKVLVSFPPLYCFTKKVAGDHAKVLSLLTTVGPHDYNPSSSDAIKPMKADLFLVNGLTLDDWVSTVANSSGNPKFIKDREKFLISVSEKLAEPKDAEKEAKDKTSFTRLKFGHHHDHDEGADAHKGHSHGTWDPHAWLGIAPAKKMVEEIRDELTKLAPQHKKEFADNAAKYLQELDRLQKKGDELFAGKTNRKIIAMHDSMKYFARSFGLEVIDSIQPQPGAPVSNPKMKQLIDRCREEKIRVIAVEPQFSDKDAKQLQEQLRKEGVAIDLVTFDTLETVDPEHAHDPDHYVRVMEKNITDLAAKLQ